MLPITLCLNSILYYTAFNSFGQSVYNLMSHIMSFIAGAVIDCEDKNGNTPLHIAARYGHELLINTLITSGADTAK